MIGRWGVVLALMPCAAWAQEDPMELQRCIWRCLADSPGAASAQYQQCVAAQCGEEPAAPVASPSFAGAGSAPWGVGVTGDGLGHYAGQVAPESGNLFYYTCDASGQQNLILSGPEGPSAVLTLEVDGQRFGLWFEQTSGGYTARLEPGSPVPGLLGAARRFELRNDAGGSLGAFAMVGAGAAIGGARAACGL